MGSNLMDVDRRISILEKKVAVLEQMLNVESTENTKYVNEVKKEYRSHVKPIVEDITVQSEHNAVKAQSVHTVSKPVEHRSAEPKAKSEIIYKPASRKSEKNTSMESFIGKNVIVVVASILIFIGVVVFASLLLPHLSTEMKFALMCLVSIAFTGFGYVLVNRKPNNFSISVLSCGLGTIYITLFTGNLYFKIVSVAVLYVALFLWTLAVYFCSKYRTFVFNLVGQIGIILSLMICVGVAMSKNDPSYVFYAVIYVAVAEILYDILFRIKGYIINASALFASVLILSIPVISEFNKNKSPMVVAMFLVLSGMFVYAVVKNIVMAKREDITQVIYSIINYVSLFVFTACMHQFDESIYLYFAMMLYYLMTFVITELIYYSEDRDVTLTILSSACICGVLFEYCRVLSESKPYVSVLVLLIPLVAYIYKSKTSCSKVVFAVGTGFATFCNMFYVLDSDYRFVVSSRSITDDWYDLPAFESVPVIQWNSIAFYITGVAVAVIGYLMFYHGKKVRKIYESICVYLFIIANCLFAFMMLSVYPSYDIDINPFTYASEIRCLVIMACMIAVQFFFRNNKFFRRIDDIFSQPTYIAYFVVNALMLFTSIYYIYDEFSVGEHFDETTIIYLMASLMLVILSTFNTSMLLAKENTVMSVYVGIKITALIFIVMHVFKVRPLVSIMLFAWAVACIMLGFKLSQKYLRLYALILALVCAVKLTMIDISYGSTLARAFSFIICGGLCFVIGYIYYYVEKIDKAKAVLNDSSDEELEDDNME